ncbi:MAG: thiamine-phosphate kinase [Sphingorhabdus sp.]
MSRESQFIDLMRAIAVDPAARQLSDDAAVLQIGQDALVLTHDMMVEGVHWRCDASPFDVAWKLVAVNLSDLAAKGASPLGVLLGFALGDEAWDRAFAEGLAKALGHFDVPLLGGDTVGGTGVRNLGLTAIGRATCDIVPARSGAQAGDLLFVTGVLGDAAAGFDLLEAGKAGPETLIAAYSRPTPLVHEGRALAPIVSAMMDVSDGLLLDAQRMARASQLAIAIDLSAIPLSSEYCSICGDGLESRLRAASWGDDYQLLFAGAAETKWPVPVKAVGSFSVGSGLSVHLDNVPVELPASLGYEHS